VEELIGIIKSVVFYAEDTHYCVLTVHQPIGNKDIPCVGTMVNPKVGNKVTLHGRYVNHPRFGRQLKFESVETPILTDIETFKDFLCSQIKGMGKRSTEAIAGNRSISAICEIMEDPEKIKKAYPHFEESVCNSVSDSWKSKKGFIDALTYLNQKGITAGIAARIAKGFGSSTRERMESNPYDIISLYGIGFKMADAIAIDKYEIKKGDPRRLKALIVYVLEEAGYEGHCFLNIKELMERMESEAGVHQTLIPMEYITNNSNIVVDDDFRVYPKKYHIYETIVADRIKMLNTENNININDSFINEYQKRREIEFSPEQKEAINNAATHSLSIITGLPGTGKTFVIQALIDMFEIMDMSYTLCAPTGKAAKRMMEVTNRNAKTIHRTLEYSPLSGWGINTENPLRTDVIIVDETSMLDIELAFRLFSGIGESRCIFVGDFAQLPSVGPGNVLKDMIESKKIKVSHLTSIFRQPAKSKIVNNAHKI